MHVEISVARLKFLKCWITIILIIIADLSISFIIGMHRRILGRARKDNVPPKVTLPLQASVDSTSIWETVNEILHLK